MVTKDSAEILRRLCDSSVEVIVVGMAAAILQGVPATTRDLDIVHKRTTDNIERLLAYCKALMPSLVTIRDAFGRTRVTFSDQDTF